MKYKQIDKMNMPKLCLYTPRTKFEFFFFSPATFFLLTRVLDGRVNSLNQSITWLIPWWDSRACLCNFIIFLLKMQPLLVSRVGGG